MSGALALGAVLMHDSRHWRRSLHVEYDEVRDRTSVSIDSGALAEAQVEHHAVQMNVTALFMCKGKNAHCLPGFVTLVFKCPTHELPQGDTSLVLDADGTQMPNGALDPPASWAAHEIRLVISDNEFYAIGGYVVGNRSGVGAARYVRGIGEDVAFRFSAENLTASRILAQQMFSYDDPSLTTFEGPPVP